MRTASTFNNKLPVFLFLFCFPVFQSFAQTSNPYHYFIDVGGFATSVKTSLTVDATNGNTGTELRLEELGLPSNPLIIRVDGLIKLKRRSSFSLIGLVINREHNYVLDKDIAVGDSIYNIGLTISTKFNTSYLGLTYRYAFFLKEKWEAGASVGLKVLDVKAGVNPVFDETTNTDKLDKTLPAPVLGLYGNYSISPKFAVTAKGEILKITISGYSGTVVDSRIAARYFFWKEFNAGIAYSYSTYRGYNLNVRDFNTDIKYRFSGFTFFLGYCF